MLEQAGADLRTQRERSIAEGGKGPKSPDAHLARQLGGYKSALKSEKFRLLQPTSHHIFIFSDPNVSPEAKAHARHMLAQHGIAS
jgi:hypothetical protein